MKKPYCSCCGKEAPFLSTRNLCEKCQKVKGALQRRVYDWRTGKLLPKKAEEKAA